MQLSIDVYADPIASRLPLGVGKLGVGDGQADGNRSSKPEASVELRSAVRFGDGDGLYLQVAENELVPEFRTGGKARFALRRGRTR